MGTRIRAVELLHPSSAKLIVAACTNGRYYVKGPPGPDGDAMLLREWVGTRLADAFGRQTLHHGVMTDPLDPAMEQIPLFDGSELRSDAVFVTQPEPGLAWEGGPEALRLVGNRASFARLVVFDTWIGNSDRHRPRPNRPAHENMANVFISTDRNRGRKPRLLAIDHTHILGDDSILSKGRDSAYVEDDTIFGLFDDFVPFVRRKDLENSIDDLRDIIFDLALSTPACWGMTREVARSVADFLFARGRFVVRGGRDRIMSAVAEG
jgi:hypothetical protein